MMAERIGFHIHGCGLRCLLGLRSWVRGGTIRAVLLRSERSAMEFDRGGSSASTLKLLQKRLRVRAGGREHRPAATRSESGAERGFVGSREASANTVEIIIRAGRASKHGRTQGSRSQGVGPVVTTAGGAGARQGRRSERGDRRKDRLPGGLSGAPVVAVAAAKGLLERVGLQRERVVDRVEVVGRVSRGRYGRSRRRRQ